MQVEDRVILLGLKKLLIYRAWLVGIIQFKWKSIFGFEGDKSVSRSVLMHELLACCFNFIHNLVFVLSHWLVLSYV